MNEEPHPMAELLEKDQRYTYEAYQFVREALSYAQDIMQMAPSGEEGEHHITGQQLCEAIRRYSVDQFGFMSKTVLNNWGVYSTSDFGEIVYNLIRIRHMKKSDSDRREDFDDVYDFQEAFDPIFEHSHNDDNIA